MHHYGIPHGARGDMLLIGSALFQGTVLIHHFVGNDTVEPKARPSMLGWPSILRSCYHNNGPNLFIVFYSSDASTVSLCRTIPKSPASGGGLFVVVSGLPRYASEIVSVLWSGPGSVRVRALIETMLPDNP